MLEHIHPADRARVHDALIAAGQVFQPLRFDARVVWADGSIHWISAHGSVYRSVGRSDRLIGFVSDITERMRTTEALQDASRCTGPTMCPACARHWQVVSRTLC